MYMHTIILPLPSHTNRVIKVGASFNECISTSEVHTLLVDATTHTRACTNIHREGESVKERERKRERGGREVKPVC